MTEFADGTYIVTALGNLSKIEPTKGYMVGVRGLGHSDALTFPSDILVGRWTDQKTGIIYWDEVELITDKSEAIALAEMYGELAIWDNANGVEIRV